MQGFCFATQENECFLFEIETQLIIAHRLGYLQEETLRSVLRETDAESRMLLSLMRALRA